MLDGLVDAELRAPQRQRRKIIERLIRTIRLRNGNRLATSSYGGVAWLGLALFRAGEVTGLNTEPMVHMINMELSRELIPDAGEGTWQQRDGRIGNALACGTSAILLARCGHSVRAAELLEWMDSALIERETGLIRDGSQFGTGKHVKNICLRSQAVFLGACVELSEVDRMERMVRTIARHCFRSAALIGRAEGDSGLPAGILASYLALVAIRLPEGPTATLARDLVLDSAKSCWSNRTQLSSGPLFSGTWSEPAPGPRLLKSSPARELSAQVGAWLLFEAAAVLEAGR